MEKIEKTKVNVSNEPIKSDHKFDNGTVLSVILKVAVPIVLLMMFNAAYAFVDSLMSSNFVIYGEKDGNPLNGGTSIGLIFPLMGMLNAFQVMHSAGGGLAYTSNVAKKDYDSAKKTFGQTFSLSWALGFIIIAFTAVIGIPYILTASGNWKGQTWGEQTHKMVLDGYSYMVILTFAFIPMTLQGSYVRVLRAEGKGTISALIPILTMPINILFDYLFMAKLNLGLKGAGLATLIATTSGVLMMVTYVFFMRKRENINISYKWENLKLRKEFFIIVFIFGLGSFYRRIFDGMNAVLMSNYVGNILIDTNKHALDITVWTRSWTMMTRSINMGTMMALGVGQSMAMLISFYNNSNQNEKVKETLKVGTICIFFVQTLASLILLSMAEILFHAYGIKEFGGFGSELGIAYIFILLFSIPMSLQIIPPLFYSGMKSPKSTLSHTMIFNFTSIFIVTIFFIIERYTGNPLFLFGGIFVGGVFGLVGASFFFNKRYRQLLSI